MQLAKRLTLQAMISLITTEKSVHYLADWILSPMLREPVDGGFFGSLNERDYNKQQQQQHQTFRGIRVNALEWLLAEGTITLKGNVTNVAFRKYCLGKAVPNFLLQSGGALTELDTNNSGSLASARQGGLVGLAAHRRIYQLSWPFMKS